MSHNKKKHHIVPVTYLSGFTDLQGKIYEYRKDEPQKPTYNIPREVGHRRYYYSQPLENGDYDHNTLEDFFSRFESQWNNLLEIIQNKKKFQNTDVELLYQFLGMLRVRVPATRDAIEYSLKKDVEHSFKLLEKLEQFPPRPESCIEIEVSIDPHKSTEDMNHRLESFGKLLGFMGYRIFHNRTDVHFITSDNPIIVFDPTIPEDKMQPYQIDRHTMACELIFPINKDYILIGNYKFSKNKNFSYENITDIQKVKRLNRLICKYGYERIFSCSQDYEKLIRKYASISPVPKIQFIGDLNFRSIIWGKRHKLPKWTK